MSCGKYDKIVSKDVEDNRFPFLSQRIKYLKESEDGRKIMCEIVEEYAKDYAVEQNKDMLKIMFENGGPLELALKMFQNISEEVIRKIYEEVTEA